MRSSLYVLAILASALAYTPAAEAVDISQCAMVADGQSEVITLESELDDGTAVTLSGILTKPDGEGPFPALLMLPGGGGLYTPYCNGVVAQQFAEWGYSSLIVASTTAQDRSGAFHHEYSFLDQAKHARAGAAALADRPEIDSARLAVWGFSRGGLTALEMAASPEDRSGSFRAIIAGAPQCHATLGPTHTPLLLIIGTEDTSVSVSACQDLASSLEQEPGFEFLLMEGAQHLYWLDADSARISARRMAEFLERHL